MGGYAFGISVDDVEYAYKKTCDGSWQTKQKSGGGFGITISHQHYANVTEKASGAIKNMLGVPGTVFLTFLKPSEILGLQKAPKQRANCSESDYKKPERNRSPYNE